MKTKISRSFLRGYAKALDLGGITKEWPDLSNNRVKDYKALRDDWENVGNAIRRETRSFKQARY